MEIEEYSKQEKYFLYNNLAIILKAIEGERTTVDLRNEASIFGRVEQGDGYMNIVMKDCIFMDPRGDRFTYDTMFVQARNIRFVHIPSKIRIIPAIKGQLERMSRQPGNTKCIKRTFKTKRALEKQQEDIAAVEKIIRDKNKTGDATN